MFSTFAKAGLAALIALGGISVTAPAASAGSDVQSRFRFRMVMVIVPAGAARIARAVAARPGLRKKRQAAWVFVARVLLMYLRAASLLQVLTATVVTASYSPMSAAAR